MNEILSRTVLPARREEIELRTEDGLTLVGELALPVDTEPVATLIMLHPLPTHGGTMDSHVFRKAAWRLPALANYAVLRFNLRGVSSDRGTSGGEFTGGSLERFDLAAALEFAEARQLPHAWLVGWSFGTDLALRYGCVEGVEGVILLSPPLHWAEPEDLEKWDASSKPVVAVVPEFDDYLRPEAARKRFADVRRAEVICVPGARHLWVGEKSVKRVLNEIVGHVTPDLAPLRPTWDGPSHVDGASVESA